MKREHQKAHIAWEQWRIVMAPFIKEGYAFEVFPGTKGVSKIVAHLPPSDVDAIVWTDKEYSQSDLRKIGAELTNLRATIKVVR